MSSFIIISVLCSVVICLPFAASISDHPLVLVVALGGFRNDYFNRGITPNLNRIRSEGTHAKHMKSVFPTKTFPNLHSIATGTYPETHGIVNNFVVDPKTRRTLNVHELQHYNDRDVVPIWILNQKHGNGRHSGVMMWPSGEDEYENVSATFRMRFDDALPLDKRVDYIFSWFDDASTPANVVMVYIEQPDKTALAFGPDSPETNDAIRKVDNFVASLESTLKTHGLWEEINVFFISDHGGSSFQMNDVIDINTFLDQSWHNGFVERTSPVLFIIPNEGYEDEIYSTLKTASSSKNFMVYRKNDLPDRWHLKHNQRTAPIIAVADVGSVFQDYISTAYKLAEVNNRNVTIDTVFGINGYDNGYPVTYSIFACIGPNLKKNYTMEDIDAVDLYQIWKNILNLTAPALDGTFENVKEILIDVNMEEPSVDYTSGVTSRHVACIIAIIMSYILTVYIR